MEIFPGDRHLRCSGCDQPYTLVIKDILGEVLIRFSKEKVEIEFLDVCKHEKLQEKNEVEECVVCYEECKTKTICNHTVCKSCYTKLKTCPYCRKDLIQNEILINDK